MFQAKNPSVRLPLIYRTWSSVNPSEERDLQLVQNLSFTKRFHFWSGPYHRLSENIQRSLQILVRRSLRNSQLGEITVWIQMP